MDKLKLHTNVTGDGKPIVFLHTGLQTGLLDFEFQRDYFSKSYRVVSPDLRGHGQSITDNIKNFFEDSAKDLLETLDHLKISAIHLVGCSLGALVAIKFAQLFPDRISSLVISGITPIKPDDWLEMHEEDVRRQTDLLTSKEIGSYFDQIHASDWRQFIHFGKDEKWYPFEDVKAVTEFEFPVLFIVGENKPNETIGATIYPEKNPNIRVAIVPFAGHLVHTEQPEIYTKIVELFIGKAV
jgi:pimeloyl-ACP methyl ester carboxylesterase